MESKTKAATRSSRKPPKAKAAPGHGCESPPRPKLTDKQAFFVESYLKCWNATEAAKQAGYSPDTAYSIGQRLLKEVEISARIKERLSEAAMSADEVLRRLATMARGNVGVFMDDEGFIDVASEEAKESRHLIKKIKVKRRVGPEEAWTETETEIELHDPQAALVHLGRHHKLFTDKVEQSGPNGGPIKVEDVGAYRGMDRADLNRGIEQALKPPPSGS